MINSERKFDQFDKQNFSVYDFLMSYKSWKITFIVFYNIVPKISVRSYLFLD